MTKNQVGTSLSKRPRFLCDVDDVIANYIQGFISAVKATGVRDIEHDHIFDQWDLAASLKLTQKEEHKVYDLIETPGFATRLNPCPGAVPAIKKIAELCDVFFVTSPLKTSPTWAYDRLQWLITQFGDEQGKKVVSTSEKYAVDGDYFLDDKIEHCRAWQEAHPRGITFLWHSAQRPIVAEALTPPTLMVTDDWNTVLQTVKVYNRDR